MQESESVSIRFVRNAELQFENLIFSFPNSQLSPNSQSKTFTKHAIIQIGYHYCQAEKPTRVVDKPMDSLYIQFSADVKETEERLTIQKMNVIKFSILLVASLWVGCATTGILNQYDHARHLQVEDIEQSIQSHRDLIHRYPDDSLVPEIRYYLGRLLQNVSRNSEAIIEFQKIQELFPGSTWSAAAGIELVGQNPPENQSDMVAQLETLRSTIDDSRIKSRADYYLGELDARNGEWIKARQKFHHAASFRSNHLDSALYWQKVGLCDLNTGNLQEAKFSLTKSLSLDTKYQANTYILLVTYHMRTGDAVAALDILFTGLDTLIDRLPLSKFADNFVSTTLTDDQLTAAELAFASGDRYFSVRKERIRRLIERGNFDLAEDYLNDLAIQYPGRIHLLEDDVTLLRNRVHSGSFEIGVLVPLSGSLSTIGQSVYRGVLMAVDDFLHKQPDLQVEILLKDTKGSPVDTEMEYINLAESDSVVAVIGPVKSSTTRIVAELASQYKLPTLTPGCPDQSVCGLSEYLYRIYPSARRESRILLKFINEAFGYPGIACIFPDIDYGRSAVQGCEEGIDEFGGELLVKAPYPTNFSRADYLLSGLIDLNPDFILLPDEAERAAQMAGQIRYQEILDPIIIGTGGWEDMLTTKIAGAHLEGSFFITEFPQLIGPRKRISEKYHLLYGESINQFVLRSYESAKIILGVLEQGAKYRERLNYLLGIPEGVQGLDGLAFFDSTGIYRPPMTIYQIKAHRMIPSCTWNGLEFRSFDIGDEPNRSHPQIEKEQ
jgi:branched-chain amino acid transport system substrate-binding protein